MVYSTFSIKGNEMSINDSWVIANACKIVSITVTYMINFHKAPSHERADSCHVNHSSVNISLESIFLNLLVQILFVAA